MNSTTERLFIIFKCNDNHDFLVRPHTPVLLALIQRCMLSFTECLQCLECQSSCHFVLKLLLKKLIKHSEPLADLGICPVHLPQKISSCIWLKQAVHLVCR